MFRYGKRNGEGQCWWEVEPCENPIENTDWDLYDLVDAALTHVAPSGATFNVRRRDVECLPNGAENESNMGQFNTVEECFTACETAAAAQGNHCNSFIFGKDGKFGHCYWEHGPCTSYEDD
jgi:hypothetical protein